MSRRERSASRSAHGGAMQLSQILLLALLASLAMFMRHHPVTRCATIRLWQRGWPCCLLPRRAKVPY